MEKLDFANRTRDLIMRSVSTVTYSTKINEILRGHIIPSRGICQGDPLSPYLFLLCAEGLSALIQSAVDRGQMEGVQICRCGPRLSHLFFTDDILISCKATLKECDELQQLLAVYEKASGKNRRSIFNAIKEKLGKVLVGWKEKLLSKAGKEVLIKAMAQAIPIYTISCFKLPDSLCDEMMGMIMNFWWGQEKEERKIAWLSRQKMCEPKCDGGLGFKNLKWFNKALLAKQGWHLQMRGDSLVYRIFKAKYFPTGDFVHASIGHNPSYTWKSLISAQSLVIEGMRWRVVLEQISRLGHNTSYTWRSLISAQSLVIEGMRWRVVLEQISRLGKISGC
ncbi:uncharacterized protein LOC136066363 [Quercus suber]|uniref:uncharacterized protein LOC136066363 n=1 Tax=Quercus suber TaxID=58331 RepID=UPI0032DF02D7